MLSIPQGCASQLGAYIQARRHDLVAAVVRSPALKRPGARQAINCANNFLERLVQELETGDRDVVDVWVDSEAEYQHAPEHASIVALACAHLGSSYVGDCGASDDITAYLTLRAIELRKRFGVDRTSDAPPVDVAKLSGEDEAVTALLAALDTFDAVTGEHSRAVGMWSGRVAKALGLNMDVAREAMFAGILHDVGKLGVPSDIVLKPGPLDAHEWKRMREHPRIGADLIERLPFLQRFAPVTLAHHERIDGQGYPRGLSADAIPRLAKIVAVADSFHAMVSRRPYRNALSVRAAIDELRAGSGSQWNSLIVAAMIDIVRSPSRDTKLRLRIAR